MELKKALPIAEKVVEALSPYCELINIAGSCRRQKPDVGDIEVVCLPKRERRLDLISGEWQKGARSKKFAEAATSLGKVTTGSLADGKWVKINLMDGIKLDLFTPIEPNYYRIFAMRTGSDDYAQKIIAGGWRRRGWCGVNGELRRMKDCISIGKDKWKCVNPHPELPPVWQSEQEFFDWLKEKWIDPIQRNL